MNGPTLAAITLDLRGGGVAAVSRLLWRVFRDEWGARCRLAALVDSRDPTSGLDSTTPARLQFGARLAKEQVLGQCPWIFYTHLSVAQVQTFVPARLQRPYGIFLHGIEAWRPLSEAQRKVVSGAALLVANSRYTAQRVAQAHPWMGPIAECPLALSPDDTLPARTDPDGDRMRPAPRVLVVARMVASERYKGHDALVDAWPQVLRAVPEATLILAGDGDDVPRLKARVASAGLDRSVVFPGFVTPQALDALYRSAAVFAMPSRDEGFGLVYLEAMAHGLPCVGSTHDAARDVIDDGITGFLVDQADREALTGRLIELLTDERLRREMGARGHGRLIERFSYDAFRSRIRSLLTDSLGSPRVSALSSASAPVR